MSIVLDAVLEANRKYAETFGSKSELPIPPGRKFAIVTCMDARLDPAKFAGLPRWARTAGITPKKRAAAAPANTSTSCPSRTWSRAWWMT